ncbi:Suppressor of the cold-sensitive snRNP bioproteinsis mutant brr1-1 [Perkinsus chesapeaki]|uniref:subtilisin n=1 Tax=Perkinsus chesapeaki TaxID=330153 RepID=A0A7J6KZN2_PERCH|nr:Suppressor of the cold-sensitive snRNP bioproteinsis mutant brr1-1 [Perkinsus chesapeaki]
MWLRFFLLGYVIGLNFALQDQREEISGTANGFPVNDPFYPQQASYLRPINVPGAWKRLKSTKVIRKRVTVALIDTGVKPDHPDLVANLVKGYNVVAGNYDTRDRDGHGTGMAGVLGATINNKLGIAGVMDLVDIMPIYRGYPPSQSKFTAAIDYVISNRKAKDIKFILLACSVDEIEPYLADKIKEANRAGILIIVTAGNLGKNITTEKSYPCALTQQFDGVLCVGATEHSKMRLTYFSNFASYVDIPAPGIDITTTGNDVGFKAMSGTSPASAIVAGVVAMLYSLAPNLSPGDIKKTLKDTSKKGLKDFSGKVALPFGRVDADKAVAKLIPR